MFIFIKDVRYAWRALFKRPLLTGTLTATLALGLGANAAIFNILAKAEREKSLAKRITLYKQANILIMKYLPAVPYAHSQPALGFEKRVSGYVASPVGTDPFEGVSIGGQ